MKSEIKSLIDLVLQFNNMNHIYWYLYITIVMAVIGYRLKVSNKLDPTKKAVGTIFLLIFLYFNIRGVFFTYNGMIAAATELKAHIPTAEILTDDMKNFLNSFSFERRITVAWTTHIIIDPVIIFIIWYDKLFKSKEKNKEEKT